MLGVWFDGVAPDTMQAILDFHYLGRAKVQGLEGLLTTAKAMNILGVKGQMREVVTKWLLAAVNKDSCLYILNNVPVNFSQVLSLANRHFLFNFEELAGTHEFLLVDENKMEELMKREKINIESEWSLFQHLLRWMRHQDPTHDPQEGQTTRGETLLAHVRWGVLGKDIFRLDVSERDLPDLWQHAEPYVTEALSILKADEDNLEQTTQEHEAGQSAVVRSMRVLLSIRHFSPRGRPAPPRHRPLSSPSPASSTGGHALHHRQISKPRVLLQSGILLPRLLRLHGHSITLSVSLSRPGRRVRRPLHGYLAQKKPPPP